MADRSRFLEGVEDYDRARPRFPESLTEAILAYRGDGSLGRVLDLAAGTGLSTRVALAAAHERIVALDLSRPMLQRLRQRLPSVPCVFGTAHRLPFRDGSFSTITCGQAWHWFDAQRAAEECRRVLVPGGVLALFWNNVDAANASWLDEQQSLLESLNPSFRRDYREYLLSAEALRKTGVFPEVTERTLAWSRTISMEDYLAYLRSKSYIRELAAEKRADFLAAQERLMRRHFPSGQIAEPFQVLVILARLPRP